MLPCISLMFWTHSSSVRMQPAPTINVAWSGRRAAAGSRSLVQRSISQAITAAPASMSDAERSACGTSWKYRTGFQSTSRRSQPAVRNTSAASAYLIVPITGLGHPDRGRSRRDLRLGQTAVRPVDQQRLQPLVPPRETPGLLGRVLERCPQALVHLGQPADL